MRRMIGRIETIGTFIARGFGALGASAPIPRGTGGRTERTAERRDANVLVDRKSAP
jgi:hypothetical protein